LPSIPHLHALDIDPKEAADLQRELVDQLRFTSIDHPIQSVAGADVSFNRGSNLISAAICLLDVKTLSLQYVALAQRTVDFPYIAGMLAFREIPALVDAWKLIPEDQIPDLMVFDGHGTVHPRGLGLASHAGLWFKRPSFGIAKNPLVGNWEEPGSTKGSTSEIISDTTPPELLGHVVRTRTDVKPVFVSAGHHMTQSEAVEWALQLSPKYRISEPIRQAHRWANRLRTQKEKPGFYRA
jgi:deoxyribonuclease V